MPSLFDTCAIVFNSGSLLNSTMGPQIDNHSVVIRINYAPVIPFESHVGNRTDIIVTTRTITQQKVYFSYMRNTTAFLYLGVGPKVRQQTVKDFEVARSVWKLDVADASSGNQCTKTMKKLHPSYIGKGCTTGMSTVMFEMRMCKKTSLFGFHGGACHPLHYFDNMALPVMLNCQARTLNQLAYGPRYKSIYHENTGEHAVMKLLVTDENFRKALICAEAGTLIIAS